MVDGETPELLRGAERSDAAKDSQELDYLRYALYYSTTLSLFQDSFIFY